MAFKPSPLSFSTPRSSPFRRPQSPASTAPLRQTTPGSSSPVKTGGVAEGIARFSSPAVTASPIPVRPHRVFAPTVEDAPDSEPPTPPRHGTTPQPAPAPAHAQSPMPVPGPARSPAARSPVPTASGIGIPTATNIGQANALSQLQPSQVRTMREAFQILDRDSDGAVNREDIADMLNQLGLPSTPVDVAQFFPPSGPQTMTMAMFLNSIATPLAAMSPPSELISALEAFDDDDSGQIDVEELRDALLHTAPEPGQRPLTAADVDKVISGFTGRRAFSKSSSKAGSLGQAKRGDVFRYQDFVNMLIGKNAGGEQASEMAEAA